VTSNSRAGFLQGARAAWVKILHTFQPSLEKTVTSPAYAPATASLKNEPIDINKESSLNYWVAALACSELELRVAVAEVGPAAKDVSNELGRVL
jgi:hypothetical protein